MADICNACGAELPSPGIWCIACAQQRVVEARADTDPQHPTELLDRMADDLDPLRAMLWRCMRRQPEHRAMYLAAYSVAVLAVLPTLAAINDATRLLELVRDHEDTPADYRAGLTRAIQVLDLARETRTKWAEINPDQGDQDGRTAT